MGEKRTLKISPSKAEIKADEKTIVSHVRSPSKTLKRGNYDDYKRSKLINYN